MLIDSAKLMIQAYLDEIRLLDSLDKMELAMELESFIDDNEHHDPDVDSLIKAFANITRRIIRHLNSRPT